MMPTLNERRRGNALVMVSAMLVLLTLIAAAYLSRTRTQRITASAIQETAGEARRAENISRQLAAEVVQHLFVKPIDPTASANYIGGDSAGNRLPPPPEAVRYGVESAPPRLGGGSAGDRLQNGLDPAVVSGREPGDVRRLAPGADGFPDGFNFPPYAVIPWTNWPDTQFPTSMPSGASTPQLPWMENAGFGSPSTFQMTGPVYGNPPGNPGFGDTRWLRSSEPVRAADLGTPGARQFAPTPGGAFFSHWAHLSWIPTPANGWRLVTDLADVEGSLRQGPMGAREDGFGTPYEQWWPDLAPAAIPVTATKPGDADTQWVAEFTRRRDRWFNGLPRNTGVDSYHALVAGRVSAQGVASYRSRALPNFIKLDDPLGIGRTDNPDAEPVPPSDEYIDGTPRNIVARTFADADGDGFTDSFWFLAPVGKERNVRTVVGVSIVDNAGMLDLNVATRFDRRTTIGFTPADLAVVTSQPELAVTRARQINYALTDTRAGLFDNEWNFSFGDLDPRDPSQGGNPAAFKTPFTRSIGFGMAFDAYRFAGRPTPQDSRVSPSHDEGSPSMLQSLGVRMVDARSADPDPDRRTFWSPYFQGPPGSALQLQPWLDGVRAIRPPRLAGSGGVPSQFGASGDPWIDVYGPGGPSRPQQVEPVVGIAGSSAGVNWQPWFRYLWGTTPRDNINGPFMRGEERTRWFQAAMQGEMRVFAPFRFGVGATAQSVEATEILPSAPVRDVGGRPIRIKPFDASDEVELRAFAGNNDSTNMSRLEKAINSDDMVRDKDFKILDSILRSSVLRAEGGPGGAQLTNAQLVKDLRRKVTAVSGQRNELMPPWLWTGRPYLALPSQNPRETYQNAMLWLGSHPEAPGPRDENNDGRIDGQELQWGVYDLWRASTSGDPFPDNSLPSFSSSSPVLDGRDWRRGVRLFEHNNRKLDLRQPLLVDTGGRDEEGLPRLKYAYSVPEERRAMLEFARDARQRLRLALRTHSPQRNQIDWSTIQDGSDLADPLSQPTVELLGPLSAATQSGTPQVRYAGYADRFVDQLRVGLDARVAEAADPSVATAAGQPTVALAADQYPWRSAWSTEAMTASLAANLATWRSRPTLMRELSANPAFSGRDLGLRAIWQPILPGLVQMPARATGAFDTDWLGVDYGDVGGVVQVREPTNAALAVRAVDPSSQGKPRFTNASTVSSGPFDASANSAEHAVPNWNFPNDPFQDPDVDSGNVVFPGIAKHPFLTECFFAWVYPATTTSVTGRIEPAVVKLKDFTGPGGTPANNGNKFVAVVNGRVGDPLTNDGVVQPGSVGGRPALAAGKDENRDELNEIRTPVLVVQVANPWNEPIRLGDFRLEMFGQRYDFPDYETDSEGNAITDADGRPVPLMLNPGTETAPATATVYLIANVLGNPTDDPNGTFPAPFVATREEEAADASKKWAQPDLHKVAQWDPWFRRRWLDYLDLYEFLDKPDTSDLASDALRLDPQPKATSPNAWPLYRVPGSDALRASKLLNAMQPDRDPNKARITSLETFKRLMLVDDSGNPGNDALKKGIVLQRVIRDPSAVSANRQLLTKNLARWNAARRRWEMAATQELQGLALEVDRFDADPGFDHFTAKVTAIPSGGTIETFKDARTNFDTNLVTGGRFWSACARITLPPAEDTSPFPGGGTRDLPKLLGSPPLDPAVPTGPRVSFDEPRGIRGCFPPPTTTALVRPASDPFTFYDASVAQSDSDVPPAAFPGIMLGDASTTAGRDYFTTWTRVARHWSRLFDVRLGTVQGLGPAIGGAGSSTPILHPEPVPAGVQSNLPVWTWTQQAVDNSFRSLGDGSGVMPRTRLSPRFVFASRTEPDQMLNPNPPKRVELTGFRASGASDQSEPGEAVEERAMGDIFRLDASSSPADPDLWTPSIGSASWMDDTSTFGWLTSPVWAPLPDFRDLGLGNRAPGDDIVSTDFPELVLRKPTAFTCQTVIDPQPGRYDATNGLAVAYYGDASRAAGAGGNPVNTSYAKVDWVVGPDEASLHPDFGRVYHGDKGARLVDHNGALLPLQIATGRPDPAKCRWTAQGAWNTLARFPSVNTMQMLWKNDDFEQLGELLDVFVWGPAYRIGAAFNDKVQPQANGLRMMIGKLRGSSVIDDSPASPVPGVPKRLYPQCRATFAEIMTGRVPGFPVGQGDMVNRLQVDPPNLAFSQDRVWQFSGHAALDMPYAPAIPWAARVFDAFTLDGPGAALRYDWSDSNAGAVAVNAPWTSTAGTKVFEPSTDPKGSGWWDTRQDRSGAANARVERPVGALFPVGCYLRPDGDASVSNDVVTRTSLAQWEYDHSPSLSGGFRGKGVKGLLNINTAPVEVLRTLPHMTQMVYDDSGRMKDKDRPPPDDGYTLGSPFAGAGAVGGDGRFNATGAAPTGKAKNPASLVPDAIEIYRDRLNPSWSLAGLASPSTGVTGAGTRVWAPNASNPLQPRDNLGPTQPTYSDRGDPVPAFGTATVAAVLDQRWSFVRAAVDPSKASRLADVPVPFNRGMRAAMGFGSIGELTLLNRTIVGDSAGQGGFGTVPPFVNTLGVSANFPDWQYDQGWSIRLAGRDPYRTSWVPGTDLSGLGQGWFADEKDNPDEPLDARLATDRQGVRFFDFDPGASMSIDDAWLLLPDDVVGDSEEQHLLFKGISNLVSTRSDVFTVYFRVRTIKQDPLTGKWNGVDPDSVLEDARYVMCVDRSNVNRPTDEPRIVYFSRVNE